MIEPVIYTDVELESYIPAGWSLAPDDRPRWDEEGNRFRFRVIDTSDLDWQLEIPREKVERLGRIEALRQAVDHLNRQRFKSIL
jgi:hypothetical protein